MPAHTQLIILIKNQLLTDRDFIFISKNASVSVFYYIIDFNTKAILMRNKSDTLIIFKKNTRLGVFTEFNNDKCFTIKIIEYNFALKPTKYIK